MLPRGAREGEIKILIRLTKVEEMLMTSLSMPFQFLNCVGLVPATTPDLQRTAEIIPLAKYERNESPPFNK